MNKSGVHSSKVNQACSVQRTNDRVSANPITINEKVNLTKEQYAVLKTICDTYEQSVSEYMHEALIEAMKFDITEGNFSDILLGKLDEEDHKKVDSSLQFRLSKINQIIFSCRKLTV